MDNYNIQENDQLYINGKWYFDVLSVESDSIKVRLKYYETATKNYYSYKVIKLPKNLFQTPTVDNFIVRCQVHEPSLKQEIGGLINRLAVETDVVALAEKITALKEDAAAANGSNTGGMGAVVNPGLSGVPGQIGSFGSGDISTTVKFASTKGGVLPKNSYGLQIMSKGNMKHNRKSSKKQKGTLIKKPLMNIGESSQIELTNSDHDYKTSVYTFLDYPADNENDLKFIGIVSEYRPEMLEISKERLVQYFRDLYNTNRALIKTKCSNWFQNAILNLAQLDS